MRYARFLPALLAVLPFSAFGLEPDQVYAKAAPSIVIVVAYDAAADKFVSLGSGVIIAPGQVITNCHVIDRADVVYLNREKHTTVGIVRYRDPDRDLCQVGATEKTGFERAVSRITTTNELRVGQKVYAIGSPQGLVLTLSDGLISSLRKIDGDTVIQTTAPISQGSSGGGLFDASGRLIGITSFYRKEGQNLNFAVPASWIGEVQKRHAAREEVARKELEDKVALEEEARRQEEQKQLEAEKLRLEAEKRRLQEEAKRTEAERLRKEEQVRIAEERQENLDRWLASPEGQEEQRQEAIRKEREASDAKLRAEVAANIAQQKLLNAWREKIQSKIWNRVLVPPGISGNPEAQFNVIVLPGGEVLTATLLKASGNAAYDEAVQKAITLSSPLPVPSDPDIFHTHFRELRLVFRPRGSWEAEATPVSSTAIADTTQVSRESYVELYAQNLGSHVLRYVDYPASARRRGLQGTTVVMFAIDAEGNVLNGYVKSSSGR